MRNDIEDKAPEFGDRPEAPADDTRRRLVKASALAPVIATVVSTGVQANGTFKLCGEDDGTSCAASLEGGTI